MDEDTLRALEIAREAIENYVRLCDDNARMYVGMDDGADAYYQGKRDGAREARELMNAAFSGRERVSARA